MAPPLISIYRTITNILIPFNISFRFKLFQEPYVRWFIMLGIHCTMVCLHSGIIADQWQYGADTVWVRHVNTQSRRRMGNSWMSAVSELFQKLVKRGLIGSLFISIFFEFFLSSALLRFVCSSSVWRLQLQELYKLCRVKQTK